MAAAFGLTAEELKNMVKKHHKAGIDVMLDVVFNHTAEGNENGPYISYRGIDNKTYYLLTPEGYYYNFSGCGNTMNCNNAVVRSFILDCLRYWVADYHINGFRFDLAAILSRDSSGAHAAQSDAAHCTVSGYGMRSSVNKQQYSTKIEGVTLLCLSEVYTNK